MEEVGPIVSAAGETVKSEDSRKYRNISMAHFTHEEISNFRQTT
jgi:hypothetical protein